MTSLPPPPPFPPPGPPPALAPALAPAPAPSLAKARWALGLAVVGPTLAGTVISLFLALGTLRRSRRTGVDHGNRLAVAALAVDALVVGALVAVGYGVLVLGVGSSPPAPEPAAAYDTDRTRNANPRAVYDLDYLGHGDCVVVPSMHGEEGAADHTVECGEPHDLEATWSFAFEGGGAYPGSAAIQHAVEACDGKPFTDYVGRPLARSSLVSTAIGITPEDWEDGRRRVICLVYDPRGPLTATLRGADR